MAKRRRDVYKERFWRRHLARWRRSKQTIRDYCASVGLSESSFYSWRRCLADRDHTSKAPTKPTRPSRSMKARVQPISTFVLLRLADDADSGVANSQVMRIEVVLADGRVLRVAPGFDAMTLRRVVAVLEGSPC